MTRRGKFVLIGLPIFVVSAAVLMLLGLFLSPANASADIPLGVDAVSVTVIEGDTLWGIAREFAPQLEPREAVRQIGDLNNLNSSVLLPGAELFVPTGS
nr:LysM peptidoglycan-binding domain-containing protein [Paeniglutamicibacter quisquiliarum]